jgi:hypothetical protein
LDAEHEYRYEPMFVDEVEELEELVENFGEESTSSSAVID